jgi:hypothetical protein
VATARRRRVSLVGAAVVAVLALLVGFGAGYAVRRVTTTTTTTVPPTTTTTTTTSTSTTTTTLKPLALCSGAVLNGAVVSSSGAAGTVTAAIQVTNVGTVTCGLHGYPTLQLLNANGAPLPTQTIRGQTQFPATAANAPPSLQRLAPQGAVTFQLQYSDVPTGTETSCPQASSINVYVPVSSAPVRVAEMLSPCSGGTVNVSPFYAAR